MGKVVIDLWRCLCSFVNIVFTRIYYMNLGEVSDFFFQQAIVLFSYN